MNTATNTTSYEVNKLHIQETIYFAIRNIPQVDDRTLDKFWDLVNADKTHTVMTYNQLTAKANLVLKYIPQACAQSLSIMVDLLGIHPMPAPKMLVEETTLLQKEAIPLVFIMNEAE